MEPVWADVKHLFSVYSVIQMRRVDPSFDLRSYAFVRENSRRILLSLQPSGLDDGMSRIPGVRQMPVNERPWPDTNIRLFERWIENGCPRGEPEPEPAQTPSLDAFWRLSRAATGFDDLSMELARRHQVRLGERFGSGVDDLVAAWEAHGVEAVRLPPHRALFDALILLWYTGMLFNERGPMDAEVPGNTTYQEGLVWRTILAHPMGYSTEEAPHWQYPPGADGSNTGLGRRR